MIIHSSPSAFGLCVLTGLFKQTWLLQQAGDATVRVPAGDTDFNSLLNPTSQGAIAQQSPPIPVAAQAVQKSPPAVATIQPATAVSPPNTPAWWQPPPAPPGNVASPAPTIKKTGGAAFV